MIEQATERAQRQADIARRLRIKAPTSTATEAAETATAPTPGARTQGESEEEPLSNRVLRQIRSGKIDEERLLPTEEKRRNDVAKKLERMRQGKGWYVFVQANAHTAGTGKAPQRRNAELAVVHEASRWRKEVERYAPDHLEEFDKMLNAGLDTPKAGSRDEG